MPLLTEYQDTERGQPEPELSPEIIRIYTESEIIEYLKSVIPCNVQGYTLTQVKELIQNAIDDIENTDFGIDTI
jgi:hypothetical protein